LLLRLLRRRFAPSRNDTFVASCVLPPVNSPIATSQNFLFTKHTLPCIIIPATCSVTNIIRDVNILCKRLYCGIFVFKEKGDR